MNSHVPQSRRKLSFSKTNVVLLVITIASAVSAWWITYDMNDPDGFKMSEFWVAALLNVALGLFVWWMTDGLWTMISRSVHASDELAQRLKELTDAVEELGTRLYGPATKSQEEDPQGDINKLWTAIELLKVGLDNVCPWTKPTEEDKVDAHALSEQVEDIDDFLSAIPVPITEVFVGKGSFESATYREIFGSRTAKFEIDVLRTEFEKTQAPEGLDWNRIETKAKEGNHRLASLYTFLRWYRQYLTKDESELNTWDELTRFWSDLDPRQKDAGLSSWIKEKRASQADHEK
jgi:hypothetical protein